MKESKNKDPSKAVLEKQLRERGEPPKKRQRLEEQNRSMAEKLTRKKKAQQHLKKKEYFRKKNESREEMIRKGNMKTLEQLIACVEPKYGKQNLCSDKLLIACCNLEKVSCRQL